MRWRRESSFIRGLHGESDSGMGGLPITRTEYERTRVRVKDD
jgi:hypothetical protein